MTFDPQSLADILVCPSCRETFACSPDALVCTNRDCRRRYEIRDEIPVLLIDDSRQLSESDWQSFLDANPRLTEPGGNHTPSQ